MLNMKPITYDLFLNLLTIPLALLTIFSMQLWQWNIPQHEHRIPWQEGTSFLKERNLELSDSVVFRLMVDSSQEGASRMFGGAMDVSDMLRWLSDVPFVE
jgi:hypothetical protein